MGLVVDCIKYTVGIGLVKCKPNLFFISFSYSKLFASSSLTIYPISSLLFLNPFFPYGPLRIFYFSFRCVSFPAVISWCFFFSFLAFSFFLTLKKKGEESWSSDTAWSQFLPPLANMFRGKSFRSSFHLTPRPSIVYE